MCEATFFTECELSEPSCQERHNDLIRCLRGDGQRTPPVEFISSAGYHVLYGASEDEPESVHLARVRGAMALVGLTNLEPSPEDKGLAPSAFYDRALGLVIVVDPDDAQAYLRAAALAHADAAVGGFAEVYEAQVSSLDQAIAASALHFGEGIFYGDAAWWKTGGMTDEELVEHLRANLYYGGVIGDAAWVARTRSYDYVDLGAMFAISYGPDAVLARWLAGEVDVVRDAYEPLVRGTAQVMRGDLAAAEGAVLDDPLPGLPEGLEYLGQDRLGPWLFHAFLARVQPRPEDTPISEDIAQAASLARDWVSDRIALIYAVDVDRVAAAWQIESTDPDWLPVLPAGWRVKREGGRITVFAGETDEVMERVIAAFAGPTTTAPQPPSGVALRALRR